MKKIYLLLLPFILANGLHAQQYLGIRGGNFAGINGAQLNPSSIVDGRLKWDVNLGSGSMTFDNTFLYIPKDSLKFFGIGHIVDLIKAKHYYTHFDTNNPNDKFDATFSTEGLGPSFFFNFAKKYALGITTAARYYNVASDVAGHVAQNAYQEMNDTTLWNTNWTDQSTKYNTLGWFEYGLNFGMVVYHKGNNEITGGVELKYLQGVAGAYIKNTDATYNIQDKDNLLFTNTSIDYGNTSYNSFDEIKKYNDLIHGHGFGGNIGFTYIHKRDSADYTYVADCKKYVDPNKSTYLYKIGLSLIDAGSINLDKASDNFHLETSGSDWVHWRGEHFSSDNDFNKSISAVFYDGDSTASFVSHNIKMGLPAAICLQGDWNFYRSLYLNAEIIQGFGHANGQGVRRPNVYSLIPRYENKWFEVSVPMSLLYYNHVTPRIGLAIRAGWFFIGGDALGGLMGLNDLEGADVYAGIHIFLPGKKYKDVPIHFENSQDITIDCGKLTTHAVTYTNGLKGKRAVNGSAISTLGPAPGPCGGDVVESWDVTACHNAHAQRTVHVQAAPPATFAVANPVTVECGEAKTSMLSYSNGLVGDCGISGNVRSKLSVPDPSKACGTDITETWDTVDACGNKLHAERIIHVNAAPAPPPPPPAPKEIEKINMSGQVILFKTGSSVIEPRLYQTLDVLAQIMISHPESKWIVEGHADNTGSDKVNDPLSQHRADAVKDYLVKKGVKAESITSIGYGARKPIASNATPEGRAKNRRAEVKVAQ